MIVVFRLEYVEVRKHYNAFNVTLKIYKFIKHNKLITIITSMLT